MAGLLAFPHSLGAQPDPVWPTGILAKRRKSWGRIAPPVGTQINWSHPLANGLAFSAVPSGASGPGSVALYGVPSPSASTATGTSAVATTLGRALKFNQATSGEIRINNAVPVADFALAAFTFACLWTWDGNTGYPYPSCLTLGYYQGATLQGINNSSAMSMQVNVGGSYYTSGNATLTPNVPTLIVGRYQSGTILDIHLFDVRTGRLLTNASTAAPTGAQNSSESIYDLTLGNNPNGNNFLGGDFHMAAMWNRVLTSSEMQLLATQPYAFFASVGNSYFSVPNLDIPNETTGGVW